MKSNFVFWGMLTTGLGMAALMGACGDSSTASSGGDGGSGGSSTSSSSSGATSTSSSSSSTTSSSSSSSSGAPKDTLGDMCSSDAECGTDMICITSDANNPQFGGGPTNGYCSKECAKDSDCPGATSTCFNFDMTAPGYCVRGCDAGKPPLMSIVDPLDPKKCWGRDDVACLDNDPMDSVPGMCVPQCGMDSQCDGNRKCDPGLGVCVDMPKGGLPTGAACMADADCEGFCLNISGGPNAPSFKMCSQGCVIGGDYKEDCGGTAEGLCAFAPDGVGLGDFAFCASACKQHDDCIFPNLWCGNVGLQTNGFCFGADKCTTEGADCLDAMMMPTGQKCTNTKNGLFCLDPYPLGAAAPDMGSSSSGGMGGAGGAGGMGTGGAGGAGGN